jgi:adenosylhomocysteine nucleosidase
MVGVMSAMREELGTLLNDVVTGGSDIVSLGGRDFFTGSLFGEEVVLAFSRWGKVASASVATTLLQRFEVDEIIFTGVAGALDPDLMVGDVVVASELIQHDMDASPLPGIEPFEIPLIGVTRFQTHPQRRKRGIQGIEAFLEMENGRGEGSALFQEAGGRAPRVWEGLVLSGDRFIAHREDRERLLQRLPDALCVEMEGASVAQVCFEHDRPCTVVRTISDTADALSPIDFPLFVQTLAGSYSRGILRALLEPAPQ